MGWPGHPGTHAAFTPLMDMHPEVTHHMNGHAEIRERGHINASPFIKCLVLWPHALSWTGAGPIEFNGIQLNTYYFLKKTLYI